MFEFSVKKPVAVSIIFLALILLGLYFGAKLNLEFFPTLDIPIATVVTIYPGAGPYEIEEQITKKIEEQAGTVPGLKKITSISQDNISIVVVKFHYGVDMNQSLAEVRDKVEVAKMALPDQARQPVVSKVDPSASPIMYIALSGTTDLRTLRTIADDNVKKELEKLDGVASVTVSGGLEREISVRPDWGKMKRLKISPSALVAAIQMQNLNVPAGNIITSDRQIQIRTVGEFKSFEEINNICLGKYGGQVIYIKDVANVVDTNKEPASIARLNGNPCVILQIRRNSDSNVVKVCDQVNNAVKSLASVMPAGAKLSVVSDDSELVRKSISAMKETAIEAALLAILVIFLFLSSFRSTLVVSLSIPISVFATFIMMYFNNISLNIITLSAFTLAIGRVVDDSIVVLENIFRFVENGYDPWKAAVEGTKEVGLAVLASTFTTMAVFLPILLISGVAGQVLGPLAKTFMTALLLSLFTALLLIPMISSRILKKEVDKKLSGLKKLTKKWQEGFQWIEKRYEGALKWALGHKFIVLATAFLLFIFSLYLMSTVPLAFQPKMDRNILSCSIDTVVGSGLMKTDKVIRQLEAICKEKFGVFTKYMVATVGSSSSSLSVSTGGTENSTTGGIQLNLISKKSRKVTSMEMQETLRKELMKFPGLSFSTAITPQYGNGSEISIVLKCDDIDRLAEVGEKYRQLFVNKVPGASELSLSWRKGKPEYRILLDDKKAAQYGLNPAAVGSVVSTYVRGTQVNDINKYKEGGRDYDITVQLPREARDTVSELSRLPIPIHDGVVSLEDVASIIPDNAPSRIERDQRARSLSIQGSASDGYVANQVIRGIAKAISENPLPEGVTWQISGQEEDRQDTFSDMFTSLMLAIFLVFAILAIQFESFVHPLTIMMAVPLEIIGVAITMKLTGEPLSMVIILALIMLTGIVVSNSILLVNYIIVLREQHGFKRLDAVLKAGPTRLRPIMMTSIATCIAMFPLALSLREGGEFFAPLGKVVIGGLISSTLFTLLVVPCFYIMMDNIAIKLHLAKKDE